MPKFFITHSWKDIDFARRLCDDLRANGLDGFFDAYSIRPGDDIATRIGKGLEECDVYIPLLSPVAVASKWCELEISTAINLSMDPDGDGRPNIIPVIVEACKLPILLRGRLYISFAGNYDEALNELLTEGFGLPPQSLAAAVNPAKPVPIPSATPSSSIRRWPFGKTGVVLAVGTVSVLLLAAGLMSMLPGGQPTAVAQGTATHTQLPTATVLPSPTFTLPIGSAKTLSDGSVMMFIPAGEYMMGSNESDKNIQVDEKPQHVVYLDAFWIGKSDVTNTQYKKCVDAGQCSVPAYWLKREIPPGMENHPVVGVSWNDAVAYAQRVGGRLPSEAEWEKAACWDDAKKVKRVYPWGNEFDGQKANTKASGIGGTTPVGKYSPQGDSPYGVSDMAGNVFDWVADWYAASYYFSSPKNNPKGADAGTFRVIRGASWNNSYADARCAFRSNIDPDFYATDIGFRVAESAP